MLGPGRGSALEFLDGRYRLIPAGGDTNRRSIMWTQDELAASGSRRSPPVLVAPTPAGTSPLGRRTEVLGAASVPIPGHQTYQPPSGARGDQIRDERLVYAGSGASGAR